MPPTKRTRQSAEDENAPQATSTSPSGTSPAAALAPGTPSTPSTRPTRRALQSTARDLDATLLPPHTHMHTAPLAPSTRAPPTPSTPSTSTSTSARPILTRSASMLAPVVPSPLTRASSYFGLSRRGNSGFASGTSTGSGFPTPSPSPSSSNSTGERVTRGSTLLRTQSTPALASPSDLKNAVALAAGGGGAGRGKGDPEDVFGSPFGSGRPGRGKENVPPKKDEEQRSKRLRVTSGRNNRGRSGSTASVRSESSSGPSLFSRSSMSAFPSPSPSPSTATSRSSSDSVDADVDFDDVERTPTKARPYRGALPSPSLSAELSSARKRIALVRVDSAASIPMLSESDGETETDEPSPKHKNAYKALKAALRLSAGAATGRKATPKQVIGREDEKAALRAYFSLRSTKDVGMYVSGPPGTGKTALVTAMGREVAEQYKVVEVGCMGLKVGDVWRRIGEGLGCGTTEDEVSACMAQRGDTLIILDEIDSLLPPPPAMPNAATSHLLSKLFAFPLLSSSARTVKLIAISNTLDLTVRAGLVLPDGTQPTVLPFKAYNALDMAAIINTRLDADADVKVDPKAVELLARKVEAQNGDLRMCLASLSAAVNLAETEWVRKSLLADGAAPLIKVALPHVIKAFSSTTQQLRGAAGSASCAAASPTTRKIRSVPLQGKMVLLSALIYLSRVRAGMSGVPSTSTSGSGSGSGSSPTGTPHKHGDLTTSTLYAAYHAVLSHEASPFPPAAESDYRDLLSNLETLGLVAVSGGAGTGAGARVGGFGMARVGSGARGGVKAAAGGAPRVELCVREEEVRVGLGLEGEAKRGSAEDEVCRVWEREEDKAQRQRERLARAVEALKRAEEE